MATPPFLFLDTSALIKRYVEEPGSDVLVELLTDSRLRGRLFTAEHVEAEFISALNKKYRRGEIGHRALVEAGQDLKRFLPAVSIVPITSDILESGANLLNSYRNSEIAAGDAFHLAAFQLVIDRVAAPEDLYLVSADGPLLHVARRKAWQTFNPEEHRPGLIGLA